MRILLLALLLAATTACTGPGADCPNISDEAMCLVKQLIINKEKEDG